MNISLTLEYLECLKKYVCDVKVDGGLFGKGKANLKGGGVKKMVTGVKLTSIAE